ncbi:uncharacterized protein [Amphiura filiformis]|uniref:uncharacterized protein n=1 Tax=Amphiura filiformis TaxID=82378 RepID=UPI003B2205B8
MLIDSGCENTILAYSVYLSIPEHNRPELIPLKPDEDVKQADDSPLEVKGRITVELKVGPVRQVLELLVSDIRHQGLLGMDFLSITGADLSTSRMALIIRGVEIPCRTAEDNYFCTRVALVQTIQIPPLQEMVVQGRVVKPLVTSEWGLLEPYIDGVPQSKGVGVARALVPAGDTIPIRLLNAQDVPRTIKKGTAVASLTPVCTENVLEAPSEITEAELPADTAQRELPEHLTELYQRSATELNKEEQIEVQELLWQYPDIFSKGDDDLGRTSLVKHSIDTKGAHPIRQPLRRLPLGQREEVEKQVADLLQRGLIEPSDSPWSSPVVLVKKKDGAFACV